MVTHYCAIGLVAYNFTVAAPLHLLYLKTAALSLSGVIDLMIVMLYSRSIVQLCWLDFTFRNFLSL